MEELQPPTWKIQKGNDSCQYIFNDEPSKASSS